VPVGVLRLLSRLHVGSSQLVLEQSSDAARGRRQAAPLKRRTAGESVRRPIFLCREDAGSRKCAGEDQKRVPARIAPRSSDAASSPESARAINTAKVTPGSTVAVFGAGGVGLAVIQGARIAGARKIIAVDKFESKLALARRLGATDTIDASHTDPVEAVRAMTPGRRCGPWDVDRRRGFCVRGDRTEERRRAGLRIARAGRHRDHRRDGSARTESRSRWLLAAVREAHPRMLHGLETVFASTCRGSSTFTSKAGSIWTT